MKRASPAQGPSSATGEKRLVGSRVIMPEPTPVFPAAEQLSWSEPGESEALATEVRLVGVSDIRGEVRQPASTEAVVRRGGLSKGEVALEAQRALQRLGSYTDDGEEAPSELACGDVELRRERTDVHHPPRHQPADRRRD